MDATEEYQISDYDKENIGEIAGGKGEWFGAHLIRLVIKADTTNRERLRAGFPSVVEAVEKWKA